MKFFGVILMICFLQVYNSNAVDSDSTTTSTTTATTASPGPKKHLSHAVIRIKNRGFLLCEGVAIGERYIVTTAKCIDKYKSSPKLLQVVVGLTSTENIDSNKNAQIRDVSEAILHPDWAASKHIIGNLAILELFTSLKQTDYVGFASYGKLVPINATVDVTGYGDADELKSRPMRRISPAERKESECDQKANQGTYCAKEKDEYDYESIFSDPAYSGAPVYSKENENDCYGVISSVPYGTITCLAFHGDWVESKTQIPRSKDQSNSTSSPQPQTQTSQTTTSTTRSN